MLLRSFSDVVVLTQNKLMTAGYIVHLYTKPSLFDERVLLKCMILVVLLSFSGLFLCFKVNPGADRENTTVMAAVSAAGEKLPPMIVFEGQFVQTTWRPEIPKTSEIYPWLFANPSGWMSSDTFYKWFEEWEVKTRSTKEGELENRLLIYDGHLSHIWYGTLELARAQKVTIIKLPPHTTDLLQPLDLSGFKSLKDYWGDILFRRLKTKRTTRLSKAEFATHLCDPEVWGKAFSPSNIKSGFRSCGIFPVDRRQYPENRFNVNLKNRYDKWVDEGKPELAAGEIDQLLNEAREIDLEDDNTNLLAPVACTPTCSNTPNTVTIHGKKGKIVSFFVPDDKPSEMQPVNNFQSTSGTPSPSASSFKEIALKKIDALQTPKTSKPPQKRQRVNPLGGVVTSDKQFEEILAEAQKKEEMEKEKRERKEERERKKIEKMKQGKISTKGIKKRSIKGRKLPAKENIDDYGEKSEDSESSDSEWDEDLYEDERPESTNKCLFPPENNIEAYEYLSTIWQELSPPTKESDIQGKVVGVIYYNNNKPYFFIGKILQRFLYDSSGLAKEFSIEVFKAAATSTSTILEEIPQHLTDIAIYPAYDVICGPLNASVLRGSKWSVPGYPLAHKTFNLVKGLKRKEEYERLLHQ